MATTLTDFYRGTTKEFQITCKINSVAVDITGDTVTFYLKTQKDDADSAAILTLAADVATSGASGIALFNITKTLSKAISHATYWAEIVWRRGVKEYIILQQKLGVLERVSDPPT